MTDMSNDGLDDTLREMLKDGQIEIIQQIPKVKWKLTEKGLQEAAKLIKEADQRSE